jgi:hypothetical protein
MPDQVNFHELWRVVGRTAKYITQLRRTWTGD